jgi:putative transposase
MSADQGQPLRIDNLGLPAEFSPGIGMGIMARKLRIHFEGAIYHVTIRGVDRRRLFDDDGDRERFVERLGLYAEEFRIRLYQFCLMANHVHLLFETPQGNVSAFMHKLQTAYTIYYNLRHGRSGHLLQGRFGAKLVEGNEYLLKLSRYIHLNPVFVGDLKTLEISDRRKALRDYRWGSYPGYAGYCKPYDFVAEAPILSLVDGNARRQRMAYRRFVEAGIAQSDEEFLSAWKGSSLAVGSDEFREEVQNRYAEAVVRAGRSEDAAFRKRAKTAAPEAVMGLVADQYGMEPSELCLRSYGQVARAVAASLLVKYSGMDQRSVGKRLNMGTGSAVSQQIRRLRASQAKDEALAEELERLERATLSILKG